MERVEAARAMMADDVVFSLAGHEVHRGRPQSPVHVRIPVADFQPTGKFIDRNEGNQNTPWSENTKARNRT
jgi:hypothetical protein